MSVQAIIIEESTGSKIFAPTGVEGEWELTLVGIRGESPGGYWAPSDVASVVVDAIFDGDSGVVE